MRHISANESLRPSTQTIVACKTKMFGNLIRTDLRSYYKKGEEFNITDEYKDFLLHLSEENPRAFIERIILLNLDKPINAYYDGDKTLLPTDEKRNQQKVVGFTTDETSIYFEDLAVDQYANLIQMLKSKAKLDALKTTLRALEDKDVNKLTMGFFKSNFDGIVSSVDKRTELIGDTHYKEASFYNYSKDGQHKQDILKKMCRLVDKFEQINGSLICYVPAYNEATIFGEKGNQSLEMYGIDDEPTVLKYAISKAKKD